VAGALNLCTEKLLRDIEADTRTISGFSVASRFAV